MGLCEILLVIVIVGDLDLEDCPEQNANAHTMSTICLLFGEHPLSVYQSAGNMYRRRRTRLAGVRPNITIQVLAHERL